MTYDGVGRRSSKAVSGTTTSFAYDGLNVVQEIAGGTSRANLLTGLALDEQYSRTDTTQGTRSFVTDALGSTLALTDGTGAIKTSYAYDPYGATTASGEVSGNSFQYTGRENDDTGLYYYRAPYYHPRFGRFVAQDPIGFAGGINSYAYVNGNPISKTDPLGLQAIPAAPPPVLSGSVTESRMPGDPGFDPWKDTTPTTGVPEPMPPPPPKGPGQGCKGLFDACRAGATKVCGPSVGLAICFALYMACQANSGE